LVAKEEIVKSKPKVRKLSKKLLLVAATEAVDEQKPVLEKEKVTKKAKETKEVKPKASKKLLIIESDDEDD
jgi:hypothetical protein